MKNFIKYLPTLLPVFTLIGSLAAPAVQAYVAGHPALALAATSILSIINHWIPSPVSK